MAPLLPQADFPELFELERWRRADVARLSEIGDELADQLGLPLFLNTSELPFEVNDLSLRLIPGGVTRIGLTARQRALLEGIIQGDEAHPLHQWLLKPLLDFSTPPTEVRLPPLLMASEPLTNEIVRGILPAFVPAPTGAPAILSGDEVARMPREQALALAERMAPLRLPSEAEWEHACRAGGDSLFFWGDDSPRGLPDEHPHPLGLVQMGYHEEICADFWHSDLSDLPADGSPRRSPSPDLPEWFTGVVRGGAASSYPWQNGNEWRTFATTWRTTQFSQREAMVHGMCALGVVRPVLPLPTA